MKAVTIFGEDVFDNHQLLGYVEDNVSYDDIIAKLNEKYNLNLVSSSRSIAFYHLYEDANGKRVKALIEPLVKFM